MSDEFFSVYIYSDIDILHMIYIYTKVPFHFELGLHCDPCRADANKRRRGRGGGVFRCF